MLLYNIALRICTEHDSASLVRANERVHEHNERNFPQAKLDSEINVPFVLNEHGDLHFLLHNNSVQIILYNLKKLKIFIGQKNDIGKSVQ